MQGENGNVSPKLGDIRMRLLSLGPHCRKIFCITAWIFVLLLIVLYIIKINRPQIDRWRDIFRYTYAIQLAPKNASLYYDRAIFYEQVQQVIQSLQDYNTAIRLSRDTELLYRCHINRGHVYLIQGEIDSAINDFLSALEYHPDDFRAFYNAGCANQSKGYYHEAEKWYSNAIFVARDSSDMAAAYANRGAARVSMNRPQEVIADCSIAIAADSNLLYAYVNRAWAYKALSLIDSYEDDMKHVDRLREIK